MNVIMNKILWGIFILSLNLLIGCSKTSETPLTREQLVVKTLTGLGNKIWMLTSISENNVAQILRPNQINYSKTYTGSTTETLSGTTVDSDKCSGKWELNGPIRLIEISNKISGPSSQTYLINEISATTLNIEYTENYKTIRKVFKAN